jgi:hypothetical protein
MLLILCQWEHVESFHAPGIADNSSRVRSREIFRNKVLFQKNHPISEWEMNSGGRIWFWNRKFIRNEASPFGIEPFVWNRISFHNISDIHLWLSWNDPLLCFWSLKVAWHSVISETHSIQEGCELIIASFDWFHFQDSVFDDVCANSISDLTLSPVIVFVCSWSITGVNRFQHHFRT